MSSRYTSDPAQIAADLRRIADQLDQLAGADLPPVQVGLHIQAVRRGGDEATRRAAVDALVRQLHLAESGGEAYAAQYGSPLSGPQVGCIELQVYTATDSEGPGDAQWTRCGAAPEPSASHPADRFPTASPPVTSSGSCRTSPRAACCSTARRPRPHGFRGPVARWRTSRPTAQR